jgi:hypothetical protein
MLRDPSLVSLESKDLRRRRVSAALPSSRRSLGSFFLWSNTGAARSRARRVKDPREDSADLSPKHPNTAPESEQTPAPIDRPGGRRGVPRDWPAHGAMVESRPPCRGDEIGKHSGLKIRRLTACRFKSGPRHHRWHKGFGELGDVVEKPRCAFFCQGTTPPPSGQLFATARSRARISLSRLMRVTSRSASSHTARHQRGYGRELLWRFHR